MSQADLAYAIRARLGATGPRTTERSIRRWEKGTHAPHADVIPALAAATGVEIGFLYDADDEEEEEEQDVLRRVAAELLLRGGNDDLVAELHAAVLQRTPSDLPLTREMRATR